MSKDLYQQAIEYERLVQQVYREALEAEGVDNIDVRHNTKIEGRSGVKHQIDVFWRYRQAGIEHTILVECKHYASHVQLGNVRDFYGVLQDIPGAKGIMVTKVGYQSGAIRYAEWYGIELKLLRKPTEEDWKGRVKDFHLRIFVRSLVSTDETPVEVTVALAPRTKNDKEWIEAAEANGGPFTENPATLTLVDIDTEEESEELRFWMPKQLNVVDKEPGGPYMEKIELKGKQILVGDHLGERRLIPLAGLLVKYHVAEHTEPELVIHGEDVVQAILKDFRTGEVDHVKRR